MPSPWFRRLLWIAVLVGAGALPAQAQALIGAVPAAADTTRPWGLDHTLRLRADTLRAEKRPVSAWRITAVTGLSVGAGLAVLETQRRRWWADRNPRFRVLNDWAYVRWSDKIGHVYSSSFFTRYYRASFEWAGVSERTAPLWAAGAAWTQMLYYEILDGFGPIWGFSPGDLAFNTVGVGFTTAQAYVPALNAFTLKASYWPSGWEGKNFTDDYAGQTFWLTANPHRLAPAGAFKEAMPEWLNLAVGYAARDRDEIDFLTTSYVYLALDIEPTILPLRGKAWETVAGWLRHVHFPAPGIRLTPRPAFVLVAY
ncbi:MAG: DUF2279 domain-containing protein [Bacteroidota bacterium]